MSLQRVLEPEVMDTVDEAIAYDKMAHAEVNQKFAADFWEVGYDDQLGADGEVLDLGAGTGLIPIEICKQAGATRPIRLMAVDLSISMLELARNNVEVANMMDRIQLDCIDAKGIQYQDGRFAAVISNSIIHHIPDPATSLAESVRVTADGGRLFFRDLYRPDSKSELEYLVETYAGQEEAHSQQMFRESLHAALTLAEIQAMVTDLGFDPSTVEMTSDRHWTWNATK